MNADYGGNPEEALISPGAPSFCGEPASPLLVKNAAPADSEGWFRQLAESAGEAFWISSADQRVVLYANRAFALLFGRTPEELARAGLSWLDCIHSDDRVRAGKSLQAGTEASSPTEFRVVQPDGSIRWLAVCQFSFRGNLAEGRALAGVAEDVTLRKESEDSLRRLSGEILLCQDAERRRIARELHDTTVQKLAALSMNLGLLESLLPWLGSKNKKLLNDSLLLAEQCSTELRTLSYLLHPPLLEELGLSGAVREYADGFARRSGLRVDLEISPDLLRLSRDAELTLFRVLQEGLANVHRHSGSRTASVRLTQEADSIILEVADTGRGMPRELASGAAALGVGLSGMRERLRYLQGRLEVESGERGTKVLAILPRPGETSHAS